MLPRTLQRTLDRASTRCPTHDYAGWAAYFVTICVARRQRLFGTLHPGGIDLTELGRLIEERWQGIPARTRRAVPEELVVMPDHLHGIIRISPPAGYQLTPGGRYFGPIQRQSLGLAINLFKGDVTRIARQRGFLAAKEPLWHRGFHDRIIRDARHLASARAYIRDNPIRAAR